MYYEGECAVPDCGRPGRDYHGDGQEIICYEHYLYDRAVLRRSQTIQQVREGTLHTEITYDRQRRQEDTSSPRLPLSPSPCLSWWDHQQALARFQEYARRVQEEGADPRLLLVLGQML